MVCSQPYFKASRPSSLKSQSMIIQIIYCKRRHHWVVITTMNCGIHEVKVFNSLCTFCDKETEATIDNLFQWDSKKVSVMFSRCQKQIGGVDCGLFAIAFATALAYGKQASKMRFVQEELRQCRCFLVNEHLSVLYVWLTQIICVYD